jgi:hypothetical protein
MQLTMPVRTLEPVASPPPLPETYRGVGGWLLLLGFGLAVTPFRIAVEIFSTHTALAENGTWLRITTPSDPGYAPGLAAFIGLETVASATFMIGSVLCLMLLAAKAASFPRLTKYYFVSFAAFQVIDVVVAAVAFNTLASTQGIIALIQTIFVAAIWLRYLAVSKRVAQTFTNTKPLVQA